MKPDNLGFGRILVPSDSPVQFRERRQARRAIVRTERALAKMKSSLLADWEKLKPFFASLPLEIRVVHAAA